MNHREIDLDQAADAVLAFFQANPEIAEKLGTIPRDEVLALFREWLKKHDKRN